MKLIMDHLARCDSLKLEANGQAKMENKGVLLVKTKLKMINMIMLLLMLEMMELMNTKLYREIKAMRLLVKPMVLVQELELWMIVSLP